MEQVAHRKRKELGLNCYSRTDSRKCDCDFATDVLFHAGDPTATNMQGFYCCPREWGPSQIKSDAFVGSNLGPIQGSKFPSTRSSTFGSLPPPSIPVLPSNNNKGSPGKSQILQAPVPSEIVKCKYGVDKIGQALDASDKASQSLLEAARGANRLIKEKKEVFEKGPLNPIMQLDIADGCKNVTKLLKEEVRSYHKEEASSELISERAWNDMSESALKDLLRAMKITSEDVKRLLDE